MSENLRLYTKALYGFDHVARLAGPDGWDRASPCAGWSARHVLGHVVAIQRYRESLILGTEPPMNPMERQDEHAGVDPYATWSAARDDVLRALDRPGTIHKIVNDWNRPTTIDASIGQNVGDTTIHSWDLARALDVDDVLDPELVAHTLAAYEPIADRMRGPMVFGARVDVAPDAGPQARLLALTGRRPD